MTVSANKNDNSKTTAVVENNNDNYTNVNNISIFCFSERK